MSSSVEAGPSGEFGPVEEPVPGGSAGAGQGASPEVRAVLHRLRRSADTAASAAAVGLLEAVAREMVASLGRFDRDTLGAWRELAHHRDAAGDAAGAVQLLERLIPDLVQALGAADPDTLQARLDLATSSANAGGSDAVLRQFHELVPALVTAVGPNDVRVIRARYDLALHTANADDLGGCVYQLQQLVPQIEQVLGADHPLLREARLDLARYSQLWGRTPGTGIGWGETVAIVHRLLVWDFGSDKEAEACLSELERRTGRRDLSDLIFGAPDDLTAEQVAALVLGGPGVPPPPSGAPGPFDGRNPFAPPA